MSNDDPIFDEPSSDGPDMPEPDVSAPDDNLPTDTTDYQLIAQQQEARLERMEQDIEFMRGRLDAADQQNTEQMMQLRRLMEKQDIAETAIQHSPNAFDTIDNIRPLPFLATDDGDGEFHEQVPISGTFTTMTDGRSSAGGTIGSALMDPPDATCYVMQFKDTSGQIRNVKIASSSPASSSVSVLRIDSNRGKGECYKAYIWTPIAGPLSVASGTFAYTDLGTQGEEVTAINTQQGDGATTHSITASPVTTKLVLGLDTGFVDENGKRCFVITTLTLGC